MNKLFLAIFCLLLLSSTAFAQAPRVRHGETDPYSALNNDLLYWSTNWQTPHAVYYFNGLGDTLYAGDVVLYKAMVLIDTLERASASDTVVIADSLKTFHWWQIRVKSENTTSSVTLRIYGLDTNYVAQGETLAVSASADGVVYSTKFWRKLNLLVVVGAASLDSTCIYAVPYQTVRTLASAADAKVAGVVAAKSSPNTYVKVYVEGICQAYLLGATTEVIAGGYLETSGTAKYGQYNVTPAAGKRLGRALESGVTNKLYWIWLNP